MTTLPIKPVKMPAALKGAANGKLDPALLAPCGVRDLKMEKTAARAMRAMVAALEAAGFKVRAWDTYRTYESQRRLFLERYVTTPLKGRPTKMWEGTVYWQLPNTAMAASPGKSNHGLGLAIDFAEERDGDKAFESISPRMVQWLVKNADRYGFSAEDQSEPWHWRYVAGDTVPPAVLEFEGGATPSPDPTPAPAPQPCAQRTLKRTSRGECVVVLQKRLAELGFNSGPADGAFGVKTERAVKQFQRSRGLRVDGIVGTQETWPALLKEAK